MWKYNLRQDPKLKDWTHDALEKTVLLWDALFGQGE